MVTATLHAQQPNFSRIASLPVGNTPALALPGDFNGDNAMDIATVNIGVNSGQSVTIHYNNGAGNFTATTTISFQYVAAKATVADFNNDNRDDIAVFSAKDTVINGQSSLYSVIIVCLSQANGSFQQITVPLPAPNSPNPNARSVMPLARTGTTNSEYGIVAADFDSNGSVDIAVSAIYFSGFFVVLNSGNGVFTQFARINTTNWVASGQLSTGDFNNDGKPDICFVQNNLPFPTPLSVVVWKNNGLVNNTLTFTPGVESPLNAYGFHNGPICADVNNDGKLDVITSVYQLNTYQGQVAVRFGDGAGNLSGSLNITVTPTYNEVGYTALTIPSVADFNADGKNDVAVVTQPTNQVGKVLFLLGNGSGTFALPSELAVGGAPQFISTADFTSDGQVDFAVSQAPINIIPTVDIYANQAVRSDFSLRGTVAGGANAAVTLSGAASRTTTASVTGDYSFGGLTNGAYTITPSLANAVFTPSSTTVTINNASLSNLNFQRILPNLTLTPTALNLGSVTLGTVSGASFTVGGVGLSGNLVLSASPASYSLSLTNSPFATQANITLSPVNNVLAPTQVFVRFSPGTTGASIGAISFMGASTASLTLSGFGTPIPPPPVLKAAFAGVRSPIDPTDVQTFTITFRNAANALVDYAGSVDFRGGTPLGSSTGTLALTRLSLGTYQASGRFVALGAYTLSLVGATSTTGTRTFTVQASANNPAPVLTSISPTATNATTSTWTLTLNGSGFIPETEVSVNGVTLATQAVAFISGAQLKVQMLQPIAGAISVRAFNPAPGGGLSAPQNLTINNPAPILASIAPASIRAGEEVVLTLTGSHFTTATVVRITRGATTSTLALLSLVSPNQATVRIPAGYLTTAATYQVSVQTPVFGGGTSAAQNLTVLGNTAVSSEFVNVPASFVAGANIPAFSIRFRDIYNNLTDAPIAHVQFGENTGASSGTLSLTRASVGTSNATVKPFYESGTYSLWINGITTTTGSRTFTVAGAADNRVTLSGVPTSIIAGSVLPAFSLRFEDAFGNLTDNGIGRLTYTRTGGSSTATLAMTRVSEGIYTAQSTVCTIAGNYTFAVSSVGAANTLGTKSASLTAAGAAQADFSGVALRIAAGTQQTAFDVSFRDAFGNLTDSGIPPNVGFSNATNATNGVSTGTVSIGARLSLGVYDAARVMFTTAGNYTLAAAGLVNGGARFFTVSTLAVQSAFVSGLAPTVVVNQILPSFTVNYRDRFGNRVNYGGPVRFTQTGMPANTGIFATTASMVGTMLTEARAFAIAGTYQISIDGLLAGAVGGETIFMAVPPPAITGIGLTNNTTLATIHAWTMTVTGTGFVPQSEVRILNVANNLINSTTVYVSPTQLRYIIPPSQADRSGVFAVTVVNPAANGGTSAAANLSIRPRINAGLRNDPDLGIIVFGSNVYDRALPISTAFPNDTVTILIPGIGFDPTSVVLWNGTALPTVFVNERLLHARLTAAQSVTVGEDTLTVRNSTQATLVSNRARFDIIPQFRFANQNIFNASCNTPVNVGFVNGQFRVNGQQEFPIGWLAQDHIPLPGRDSVPAFNRQPTRLGLTNAILQYQNTASAFGYTWFTGILDTMYLNGTRSQADDNIDLMIPLTRQYLNGLQRVGLKAIVDLPRYYPGYDGRHVPETPRPIAEIVRFVDSLRNHCAVLGWYIADEPEQFPQNNSAHSFYKNPVNARPLYAAIKAVDPNHPVFVVSFAPTLGWDNASIIRNYDNLFYNPTEPQFCDVILRENPPILRYNCGNPATPCFDIYQYNQQYQPSLGRTYINVPGISAIGLTVSEANGNDRNDTVTRAPTMVERIANNFAAIYFAQLTKDASRQPNVAAMIFNNFSMSVVADERPNTLVPNSVTAAGQFIDFFMQNNLDEIIAAPYDGGLGAVSIYMQPFPFQDHQMLTMVREWGDSYYIIVINMVNNGTAFQTVHPLELSWRTSAPLETTVTPMIPPGMPSYAAPSLIKTVITAPDDANYTLFDYAPLQPAETRIYRIRKSNGLVAEKSVSSLSGFNSTMQQQAGLLTNERSKALAISISPNPTEGEAAITFSLPTAQAVRLILTDIFGRTMQTMYEGKAESGESVFVAHLQNLPSGTYWIRLFGESGVSTMPIHIRK